MKKVYDFTGKVINFSGGKTSAYMTIREYEPGDIVLFCDTKREHPKTYKFLNDFEAHENIPITRATYTHWKVPGLEGFDALMAWKTIVPSRNRRICTTELKVNTAKRLLRPLIGMKFEQLIGLRADEMPRIKDFKPTYAQSTMRFPLMEDGLTKQDVNDFWLSKPYTLEIPPIFGNCTLCFLKGINVLILILQQEPELANPWINDEKQVKSNKILAQLENVKAQYFPNLTMEQILSLARNAGKQVDMNLLTPAYSCVCTA